MSTMKCLYCEHDINILEVLQNSPFSWPEMATIWYECKKCGKGNHINFKEGNYGQIKFLGAPGPHWEQMASFYNASINIRQDPAFLHVWVDGVHYEVPARK